MGVPSAATGSPAVPIPPFRRAWAFPPGGGDRGLSGAVIEGGVAIAAGTAGVYGVVLKSGTPAWPKIPRGGGPISMPAVGRVAGKPAVLFTQGAKADTAKLVAYDLATRKLLWADPLGSVTRSGVTVEGDRAYVGDDGGTLHAVDVTTGHEVWTAKSPGAIDSPPLVTPTGLVCVASSSATTGNAQLHAFDADTGKVAWGLVPPNLASVSALSAADGLVFVAFFDRFLRGVDERSGAQRWSTLLQSPVSPASASAVAGGALYATDLSGTLSRISVSTGARAWEFRFNPVREVSPPYPFIASSPVIVGPDVLVGLQDGEVAAVDRTSGHLVWRVDTGEGAIGPFAIGGGLVVASKQGSNGGLIGLAPDPQGRLVNVVSPTALDVGRMLVNFAVAFVIVGGAILGSFGLLARVGKADGSDVSASETSDASEAPDSGDR